MLAISKKQKEASVTERHCTRTAMIGNESRQVISRTGLQAILRTGFNCVKWKSLVVLEQGNDMVSIMF